MVCQPTILGAANWRTLRFIISYLVIGLVLLSDLSQARTVSENAWWKDSWEREFVGAPKFAELTKDSVIVGTESNVVAALDKESGAIRWRRPLLDGELLVGMSRYDNWLVSLSSQVLEPSQMVVRVWSSSDGGLIREYFLPLDAPQFGTDEAVISNEVIQQARLKQVQDSLKEDDLEIVIAGPWGDLGGFSTESSLAGLEKIVFSTVQPGSDAEELPPFAVFARNTVYFLSLKSDSPLAVLSSTDMTRRLGLRDAKAAVVGVARARHAPHSFLITGIVYSGDGLITDVATLRVVIQGTSARTKALGSTKLSNPVALSKIYQLLIVPVWVKTGALVFLDRETNKLTFCGPTPQENSHQCVATDELTVALQSLLTGGKLTAEPPSIELPSINRHEQAFAPHDTLVVAFTPYVAYIRFNISQGSVRLDVVAHVRNDKNKPLRSKLCRPLAASSAKDASDFTRAYDSSPVVARVVGGDDVLPTLQILSLGSEGEDPLTNERTYANRGHIKRCFVSAQNDELYEAYILSSDESFARITPRVSGANWVTEQALANVAAINFVELPGAFDRGAETVTFPGIAERAGLFVKSAVGLAKNLVSLLTDLTKLQAEKNQDLSAQIGNQVLKQTRAGVLTPLYMSPLATPAAGHHKNSFGDRQLVLFTTAAGKVFAFLSDTGNLVWTSFMGPLVARAFHLEKFHNVLKSGSYEHRGKHVLDMLNSPGYIPMTYQVEITAVHAVYQLRPRSAVAIFEANDADSGSRTALVGFDPLTGKPHTISYHYTPQPAVIEDSVALLTPKVANILPLPWTSLSQSEPLTDPEFHASTHDNGRILLITFNDNSIAVVPGSKIAIDTLANKAGLMYFNKFRGHSILGQRITKDLHVEEMWRREIPASEKILAVATTSDAPVYSAIRVIGDFQDSLTRYIRPNLIAVATQQNISSELSNVVILIIDAITGDLVHRAVQSRAQGPAHLAIVQNSVIAHYRSMAHGNYEVTVLDFYDKLSMAQYQARVAVNAGNKAARVSDETTRALSTSPLSAADSSHVVSSYDFQLNREASLPAVLQQSYAFPSAIRGIGVSRSRLGVTPPEFYFLLENDYIATIPRNWLDARRPQGQPTQQDSEEGLIPYLPFMEPVPTQYLSHNRTISRASKFMAAPTGLESTSLVTVAGLDIFVGRSHPAGRFDVLSDDFAYGFLIFTVTAVLAGVWYSYTAAQRATLKREWK